MSAAGRVVAAGGAPSLQSESNALEEARLRCEGLRARLAEEEDGLRRRLRPRLTEATAAAVPARAERAELQKALESLADARLRAAEEVGGLSKKQLAEIRQLLRSPPEPVKRTLAAAWLLLHSHRFKDKPASAVRFDEKADWPRCQKMLVDEGFVSSVLSYDAKQLDEAPAVAAHVATVYFGLSTGTASTPAPGASAKPGLRRSATVPVKAPLELPAVARASAPCETLLRWVQELVAEHVSRVRLQEALRAAEAKAADAEAAEATAEADVAEAEASLGRLREALSAEEAALAALTAEKAAAEKAVRDLRKLESLGTVRPKAAPTAPAASRPPKKIPEIELEVNSTLAVVEQKLAQCGIPFSDASSELLAGDPKQALLLPQIAEVLKEHRGKLKLLLEGHQTSGEETGLDLDRSLAVYQWLVEVAGSAPGLLRLKGCGTSAGLGPVVVPLPIREMVVRSGPLPAEMEMMSYPSGLYFAEGSTELLQEAKPLLAVFSKNLVEDEYSVRIEGHVDKKENADIAGQRAAKIRDLLADLGVPGSKMKPQSCKAFHPLSRTQLAVNRRVEIHIL